jgi:membrane protein DedA with SNARE-associated domain
MVILLFRFCPGFRIIVPLAIGMFKYARTKFLVYDTISDIITSTFLVMLGYNFGELIEKTLTGTKEYDLWIALAIGIIAILATLMNDIGNLSQQ